MRFRKKFLATVEMPAQRSVTPDVTLLFEWSVVEPSLAVASLLFITNRK